MIRKTFVVLLAACYVIGYVACLPVLNKTRSTPETPEKDKGQQQETKDDKLGLQYERYLKEVISALEADESFRKKLEESNVSDIKIDQLSYKKYLQEVMGVLMTDPGWSEKLAKAAQKSTFESGEIARHLDFVAHGVRTQLDEIKRKEVERLREVMRRKAFLQKGLKATHPDYVVPDNSNLRAHIDHDNPHSFEISDLSKLIVQTTKDLEDIDKKRKEEFKIYEMEKEVLKREHLKGLNESQRADQEKKFEEMQKKHDDHPKLNHPGNEEQLKEVWEETDGLNKKEFDPKTFFHLHDTNSDGFLDSEEIEALFQKELDKVYDPNAPEDDMMERYEEMNRMREHVMKEIDRNSDQMISLEEFIASTKQEEFRKEETWEPLDKEEVFSEDDLAEFQKTYDHRLKTEQEQLEEDEKVQGGQRKEDNAIPKGSVRVDQEKSLNKSDSRDLNSLAQQPKDVRQQPAEQPVVPQQPVDKEGKPEVNLQPVERPHADDQKPLTDDQKPLADDQQPLVFEHKPVVDVKPAPNDHQPQQPVVDAQQQEHQRLPKHL